MALMLRRLLASAILSTGAAACFQSEFILYGAECMAGEACEDAVGEASAQRACFLPDPEAPAGYCSIQCESEGVTCAPHDGLLPVCLKRQREDGGSLFICALTCEADADCPQSMRCEPDPRGGTWWLCIP
jgi:hypothetical protein